MSGRGMTATPNDDGTVTVQQAGSDVEMTYTPQQVEDSEGFSLSEKYFLRELFRSAKPTSGGSCRID